MEDISFNGRPVGRERQEENEKLLHPVTGAEKDVASSSIETEKYRELPVESDDAERQVVSGLTEADSDEKKNRESLAEKYRLDDAGKEVVSSSTEIDSDEKKNRESHAEKDKLEDAGKEVASSSTGYTSEVKKDGKSKKAMAVDEIPIKNILKINNNNNRSESVTQQARIQFMPIEKIHIKPIKGILKKSTGDNNNGEEGGGGGQTDTPNRVLSWNILEIIPLPSARNHSVLTKLKNLFVRYFRVKKK